MRTNHKSLLFLVAIAILGVIGYAAWQYRSGRSAQPGQRAARCYQDSMHPWVKSDRPGKCTICGMDLTPVYEGDQGFAVGDNMVVLSSNNITVLNVQADEVKRQPLVHTLWVAGSLDANETRKTIVSAPTRGRIDALAVDYAGVEVKAGQKLITMFSPELLQQRRYLFAARSGNQRGQSNDAVRAAIEADPFTDDILAPQAGTIVERNVYAGQYVAEGDKLLTIVDASILWFRFDVYERQLPWIKTGQTVDVSVPAFPGKKFPAVISFVEPTIDDATRAVKVRADIANPVVTTPGDAQRLLRFGMTAEGRVRTEIPNVLAVPRTAILFPGGAAYAYVDKGDGAYERRRVMLGRQGDDLWEVLQGLEEGDRVVTSGNVLIDAQAQFSQHAQPDKPRDEDPVNAEPVAGRDPDPSMHGPASNACCLPVPVAPGKPETTLSLAIKSGTTNPGPTGADGVRAYREMDLARTALSEKMQVVRRAAMAGTQVTTAEPATPLTAAQRQALAAFMAIAAGISQALAADDLEQFNRHIASLPGVLPPLQKEFDAAHRWHGVLQHLAVPDAGSPAADLAEARKQFLPFSTAVVELAKLLRKEDPSFAGLKIYHCPMAPQPGLWIQAKGPLRNPFYGAAMLTCGEEVKP